MERHKILYVDDEPTNLMLFEINLKNKYNVLTVENGMDGLQLLEDNSDIKVVISDMKMPKMNGIVFIEKAKEINPQMKCFILTGYGVTSEIEEAVKNRLIINCLSKPFEMNKIDLEIIKAINN